MSLFLEVISLDVWGNSDDGYNVNDAFRTGIVLELSGEDFSDSELAHALESNGIMAEGYGADSIEIDGDPDFMVTVDDVVTGEPLWQLMPL